MPSPHVEGRIRSVASAGSRGVTIELDLYLEAQPGQIVMAWLPGVDEKPFSLVDDEPVTLTIVRVGPFTERMQQLQLGQPLYLRARPRLVAGGCGMAQLAFLAQRLIEAGRQVTVALGARSAAELLLADRVASYGVELLLSTEDGSLGQRGLVTEVAARQLATGKHDHVYACGPEAMLEEVAKICRDLEIPGELSWEAYMRCGIGVCGSCDRGDGLLVCRDGPVFPAW